MSKSVEILIDDLIFKLIDENTSLIDISNNLKKRADNIFNIVKKDYNTIDEFLNTKNKIEGNIKYTYSYIYNFTKRQNDLLWMVKNRQKFNKLKDKEFFKLIIFRDKLKNETRKNRKFNRR